jgi:membrane-associated phospholipid phosphatase
MEAGRGGHGRVLALGSAVLAATGILAGAGRVGRRERRLFHRVNELPEAMYGPVWVVMQGGTFGTVPAVSAVAALAGHDSLARRLAISGTSAWLLAKGVKRVVRRGRPDALLAGVRVRGKVDLSLGFVSGHAAVATALAVTAAPDLPAPIRPALYAAAATVGLARIYVGAHLPLDVLGGAALGLAIASFTAPAAQPGARAG